MRMRQRQRLSPTRDNQAMSSEQLHLRLLAAVEEAWRAGSPVAGQQAPDRRRIVHAAVRRWNSFPRRNIKARGDLAERRVEDLAKGLCERVEQRPNLAGPLMDDYRWLAGETLRGLQRINCDEQRLTSRARRAPIGRYPKVNHGDSSGLKGTQGRSTLRGASSERAGQRACRCPLRASRFTPSHCSRYASALTPGYGDDVRVGAHLAHGLGEACTCRVLAARLGLQRGHGTG